MFCSKSFDLNSTNLNGLFNRKTFPLMGFEPGAAVEDILKYARHAALKYEMMWNPTYLPTWTTVVLVKSS